MAGPGASDAYWKSLGLAAPARRALIKADIHALDDLQRWSRQQVAELHGMGPNALAKLHAALADAGLDFSL